MLLLLLLPPAGWCPSIVSSLGGGGPAALDSGRPLLSQAASQGNATLLSKLLNQPDPTTTYTSVNTSSTTSVDNKPDHLDRNHHLYYNHNQTSALFAAAHNGHTGNRNLTSKPFEQLLRLLGLNVKSIFFGIFTLLSLCEIR